MQNRRSASTDGNLHEDRQWLQDLAAGRPNDRCIVPRIYIHGFTIADLHGRIDNLFSNLPWIQIKEGNRHDHYSKL